MRETLGVDYLVLVGELKLDEGEGEGFLVPLLAGAMSIESASTISAVIIDLSTGELISRIECKARGTTRMVYYVIFIAGSGPMSLESGAAEGLAREIGKVITELAPARKRRVAILALEFPGKIENTIEDEDTKKGLENIKKRAEAGDAEAQLQMYYVERPNRSSLRWLCRAAEQGQRHAQRELAGAYELGARLVKRDPVQAYVWYSLAIHGGAN